MALRVRIWEVWQDAVPQWEDIRVHMVRPQPWSQLGAPNALIVVVEITGFGHEHFPHPILALQTTMHNELVYSPQARYCRDRLNRSRLMKIFKDGSLCLPYGFRLCRPIVANRELQATNEAPVSNGALVQLMVDDAPHRFAMASIWCPAIEQLAIEMNRDFEDGQQVFTLALVYGTGTVSRCPMSYDDVIHPERMLQLVQRHTGYVTPVVHFTLLQAIDSVVVADPFEYFCFVQSERSDDETAVLVVTQRQQADGELIHVGLAIRTWTTVPSLASMHHGLCQQHGFPAEGTFAFFSATQKVDDFRSFRSGHIVVHVMQELHADGIITPMAQSEAHGEGTDATLSDDSMLLQISQVPVTLADKLPEPDLSLQPIWTLTQIAQELSLPNWFGFRGDFECIPDLHPAAQAAIQWTPQCSSNAVHGKELHIFTDGSAGTHSASWAFVVLCQQNECFARVGFAGAMLDDSIGRFHVTAADAEATALVAMVDFVLSNSLAPTSIHIHFDAHAVGFGATGYQASPLYHGYISERQRAARVFISLLQMHHAVFGHHVHAHEGNPFNEMVDGIANATRKGWKGHVIPQLRGLSLLQHPLRDWAWYILNTDRSLPPLVKLLTGPPCVEGEYIPDPALAPSQLPTAPTVIELKLATANVTTLGYKKGEEVAHCHKVHELAKQFHDLSFTVIALQETRGAHNCIRQTDAFWRLCAAGVQGQAGVEIWINREASFFRNLNLDLQEKDLVVWHADPRCLAVQLAWGQGHLHFISVYAPQAGHAQNDIENWWQNLSQVLARRPSGGPVFLLGDCNGRVGSITTTVIGDQTADFEDIGGAAFHHICQRHQLIVPSTFAKWHKGQSHTYCGPWGHKSRIDYIAVSEECQEGISISQVMPEIDLMNGSNEHSVLTLELHLTLRPASKPQFARKAIYNRESAQKDVASTIDIPSVPWEVEANAHWSQVRESIQHQCRTSYARPKRSCRQNYFSPRAWNLLVSGKEMRQLHRSLDRQRDHLLIKQVFTLWKGRDGWQDEFSVQQKAAHIHDLETAATWKCRLMLQQRFRALKTADWREWVLGQNERDANQARGLKGAALFRTLKPKQAIQKAKFGRHRPHPGLKQGANWCQGRTSIAIAWEAQFGALENADPIDIGELHRKSVPTNRNLKPIDLEQLPTLYELEDALRQVDVTKAAGVDGIGGEIWKRDVVQTARWMYPLLLKAAVNGQWIVEFSGGWLLPLWKRKGNPHDMGSYRGILLEPVIARAFSRTWRARLVDTAESWTQPMQWGGRKGLSIEALHLQTRMWQANSRFRKECCALIFVDIRAAFYSVAKPMLANASWDQEGIQALFHRLRLPQTAYDTFLEHAQSADLVRRCTNSEVTAKSIKATLDHSWFVIPDGQSIHAPTTGSRPGDPLADLLFTMLMSHILGEINDRVLKEWGPSEMEDVLHLSRNATWVDDSVFVVHSETDTFVPKVIWMLQTIVDVMVEHGVTLSYGQGKTAVLMNFQGKGSESQRRWFEETYKGQISFLTEHYGLTTVPVVGHYKHLGGFLVRNGSLLPEVKVRGAQTMTQLRPIRRMLSNPNIELAQRQHLLATLGMPVVCLHVGTWFQMNDGEHEAWAANLHRIYSMIVPRDKGRHPLHTMVELAHLANQPMPQDLLHIMKVRLFIQIVRQEDMHVIGAVRHQHRLMGSKSWVSEVIQALDWVARQRGDHDWPEGVVRELDNDEAWDWAHLHTHLYKRWLKQAIANHKQRISMLVRFRFYENAQKTLLQELGWTVALSPSVAATPQVMCPQCQAVFRTDADVAVHQQRVHGGRVALRRYIVDGACRVCKKMFHTRARLLQHLHYGKSPCWYLHMRRYAPMSQQDTQQLDLQDCQQGRAHHQRGIAATAHDLACRDCTSAELSDVLKATDNSDLGPPTPDELIQWAKLGPLPPGQGGRQHSRRSQKGFQHHDVIEELACDEKAICEQVAKWSVHSSPPPSLATNEKFVLIFFSGHRREGDIPDWLRWQSDLIPVAIDVAIHPHHGDIHRDDLWLRLIYARRVVAGHAGPPCETYTPARWLPTESESPFPRPLRDALFPWGVPYRSSKEVKQVISGSILMLRTLQLLLLIYIHGGSFTLKHPRGNWWDKRQWCIWFSGMIARLCKAPDIRLTHFLQGPLGQPFKAYGFHACTFTAFGVAHLPEL